MMRFRWIFIVSIVMHSMTTYAMIFDNQYWPLFPEKFLSTQTLPDARFYWDLRGVLLGADAAYINDEDDPVGSDEAVTFSQIFGDYDEQEIDRALQLSGRTTSSLLPPGLMNTKLPWLIPGKSSLRGLAFEFELFPHKNFGIGGSIFAGHMHAETNSIFINQNGFFSPNEVVELRTANAAMREALGVTPGIAHKGVFGDMDLYLHGRIRRYYWHTIHRFEVGLRFGTLIPTAARTSIINPVGLTIGGDGHLGLYGQLDTELLLKDLMTVGFSLQVIKRLAKTAIHRMPVETEPTNYGALVGSARVNPGVTLAFYPYVQVGGLRDGLGLIGAYYLVWHATDHWSIPACANLPAKPNTCLLEKRSKWGSDHFSVGAFYDFGFEREACWHTPIISLTIDIPWHGPVTQMVPKSHGISLRIESRI